eukprot:1333524-Pleurochrysis_carterae.AAC.1
MMNRVHAAVRAANKGKYGGPLRAGGAGTAPYRGALTGPRPQGEDETHAGRGGALRSPGAGRPAGQEAVGPQPESRQGTGAAGGPMAASIEELEAENQRLCDKITELTLNYYMTCYVSCSMRIT